MINGEKEVFPFEEKYTVENVAEKLGVSVEKVIKKLNKFKNNKLRHTNQYILETFFKNGLNFSKSITKGIILKEDFIEEYYRSREEKNRMIFNIDFSLLPKIIQTRNTKVPIIINEYSRTGELIGKVLVYYTRFILESRDNNKLRRLERFYVDQERKTKEFIESSKKKFPNKFSYEKTKFIRMDRNLTLTCLTCGNDFEQTPNQHFIGSGLCPDCSRVHSAELRRMSEETFFKIVKDRYGDVLDFSNTKFNGLKDTFGKPLSVEVRNIVTGKTLMYRASTLVGNKRIKLKWLSKGEQVIQDTLTSMNLEFEKQKVFEITENCMPQLINIRKRVVVDFYLEYNHKKYIIEYNGEQHYKLIPSFHGDNIKTYSERITRDKIVKQYCLDNNIIFIEIPYSEELNKNLIFSKLSKIIYDGMLPNLIFKIIIPENYE